MLKNQNDLNLTSFGGVKWSELFFSLSKFSTVILKFQSCNLLKRYIQIPQLMLHAA